MQVPIIQYHKHGDTFTMRGTCTGDDKLPMNLTGFNLQSQMRNQGKLVHQFIINITDIQLGEFEAEELDSTTMPVDVPLEVDLLVFFEGKKVHTNKLIIVFERTSTAFIPLPPTQSLL